MDKTVILVDDLEAIRRPMSALLRLHGFRNTYSFATAHAAQTLLESIKDHEINRTMIIMDVNLGPADLYSDGCAAGRSFCRRWPGLRLLLLSGHDKEDVRLRCPGRVPIVMKPVTIEELTHIMHHLFEAPPWSPPPTVFNHRRGDKEPPP